VKLKADCSFSAKVTFRRGLRQLSSLRIRASFQGSDGLLPSASRRAAPRR